MKRNCLWLGIPVDIDELTVSASHSDGQELWGFCFGDRMHLISQVVDGWTSEEHKYVQVEVQGGRRFMLRQDAVTQDWTASPLIRG
jgi:hypothetical protein